MHRFADSDFDSDFVDRTISLDEQAQIVFERLAEKRKAEREAAARARGEYVPSAAMSIAASCCSMALAQRGVFGLDVEPVQHREREGFVAITPADPARPQATAEQVIEALLFCYPESEPTMSGNAIWARIAPFGANL